MVNVEGFITISELLPLPDNTLARYLVKVISGLFDESRSERLTIINRAAERKHQTTACDIFEPTDLRDFGFEI